VHYVKAKPTKPVPHMPAFRHATRGSGLALVASDHLWCSADGTALTGGHADFEFITTSTAAFTASMLVVTAALTAVNGRAQSGAVSSV
jgi:hypothetical protein